jgi:Tfp pilus assembly protein FimT
MIETLIVVAITGVIAAIALPMMKNTLGDFRLSGDARGLNNAASLAKLRAASNFSQARLYVDLSGASFHLETWNKTALAWTSEGGTTALSSNDTFTFGAVGSAPLNTQSTIGQAAACVTDAGVAIAGTACLLFNSRGIPVAPSPPPPPRNVGAPTGNDALYLSDGTAVYGLTISATGLIKLWRTNLRATPSWVLQ